MAVQRVLLLGDPALRRPSRPAADAGTAALSSLAGDLADTLAALRQRHGFGRGLAAPQIGVPLRVVFINVDGPLALLDPVVAGGDGEILLWDDCFSLPGLIMRLTRQRRVTVRYRRLDGDEAELGAEGGLAELLQHEIDHLDGVLAIDRVASARDVWLREEWLRQGRPNP